MWFNNIEKENLSPFIRSLRESRTELFKLVWNDKATIYASYETAYESENGLDEDDPDYEEYYVCVVKVHQILQDIGDHDLEIPDEGCLYEINYHNIPDCYELLK